MGALATSPVPSRGSPKLYRGGGGGEIRSRPKKDGLATSPTIWGDPDASKPGTKSEVAHKLAGWLHHPYHMGGSKGFKAGGQNQK